MRLNKYFLPAFMIGMTIALTGCGEKFPSLTDEEYDRTVEYAVGLLMKYSRNEQARLTYVDANYEKKKREAKAMELAQAEDDNAHLTPDPSQNEYKDDEISADVSSSGSEASSLASDDKAGDESSSSESTDASTGESSKSASSNTGSDNNSSNTDSKAGSGSTSSNMGEKGAITLSADDTQEILNDIFLSYQGYSVSSTYPESSKSYVINADKGKKLLVLRFDLYNASNSAKEVNMLKLDLLFQIILNGKNIGYSSVTFLPNDLTSYVGTIDSRAHESLAILTQIDEKNASNVETLGLIMTEDGKEQRINLR